MSDNCDAVTRSLRLLRRPGVGSTVSVRAPRRPAGGRSPTGRGARLKTGFSVGSSPTAPTTSSARAPGALELVDRARQERGHLPPRRRVLGAVGVVGAADGRTGIGECVDGPLGVAAVVVGEVVGPWESGRTPMPSHTATSPRSASSAGQNTSGPATRDHARRGQRVDGRRMHRSGVVEEPVRCVRRSCDDQVAWRPRVAWPRHLCGVVGHRSWRHRSIPCRTRARGRRSRPT